MAWVLTSRGLAALFAALPAALLCSPAPAQDSLDSLAGYAQAQDYMLLRINNERAREGAPPVRLDLAAGEAALRHARDMRERGYFSHWDLEGRKPTRRWNLLGGYDNLAENIYYRQYYLGDLRKIVDDAMATLLDSPGHRKTILYHDFTSVGLAFEYSAATEEVWVVQEFSARLGGEYSCPLEARAGETVRLTGRFDPGRFTLDNLVVAWEELPQARSKAWLARTSEYSDGEVFFAGYHLDQRIQFKGMQTFHSVAVDPAGGQFAADIALDYKRKPGTYYIFIWLRELEAPNAVLAAVATVEARR